MGAVLRIILQPVHKFARNVAEQWAVAAVSDKKGADQISPVRLTHDEATNRATGIDEIAQIVEQQLGVDFAALCCHAAWQGLLWITQIAAELVLVVLE
jgi:hypothetical protein